MIISTLNYSSVMNREKEEVAKKRHAASKAQEERDKAVERDQVRYTTPSRAQGTQTTEEVGVATEFSG